MTKKYKALDADGMPLSEQEKLKPLITKKYQVSFKLKNGRIRYAYSDDSSAVELYVKSIGAKILKIQKIKQKK